MSGDGSMAPIGDTLHAQPSLLDAAMPGPEVPAELSAVIMPPQEAHPLDSTPSNA
jgi:hypothetical protein